MLVVAFAPLPLAAFSAKAACAGWSRRASSLSHARHPFPDAEPDSKKSGAATVGGGGARHRGRFVIARSALHARSARRQAIAVKNVFANDRRHSTHQNGMTTFWVLLWRALFLLLRRFLSA